MNKIVIIGAGSGFGGRLSVDIMSRKVLQDSKICLCDLHSGRLAKVRDYVKRTAEKYDLPTEVVTSTDRRELLPDADFVITSISVGGGAYYGYPYKDEIEIPRKYGIDQSVADTTGVGAVFRFLRTAPVQNQILKDVERLAPDALVLNHTNPMAMLSWVHCVDTSLDYVGLCHGVQGTARTLAGLLDIEPDDVSYLAAGINHMAWFLEFKRDEQDLYPQLFELLEEKEKIKGEEVRFELMKQFGYFPTESSRHDSEYLPYFRRTPELRDKYNLSELDVGDEQPRGRTWIWMRDTEDGEPPAGELRSSSEYTSGIMEAVLTDKPFTFNGNVMNTGLITNLPQNSCVEVPCTADASGIHPSYVGDLPAQLAALNRSNISVHELAVQAYLERDREAAFQACAVSPLASSLLTLDEIRDMFEELWEAEGALLEWFDSDFDGEISEPFAE